VTIIIYVRLLLCMNKPIITVIVPVLNEAEYIDAMIDSLLQQQQENFSMELLLIDGGSTDGTLEKIKSYTQQFSFIRIIHNEKHITPVAFNRGIQSAKGEYIALLGAHSKYDPDYLETCLGEMHQQNADGCSGRVIIAGSDAKGEAALVYCLLTSNFGVSNKSYRTAKEGPGEQCPYPLFKRSIFDVVGHYNELLPRNQDNDMNYRIRKAGYKLYYTYKTTACYYHPQNIRGLLKYAIRTGKGNAVSLKISPASMSFRHVIPMFFTAFLVLLLSGLMFTIFISLKAAGIGAIIFLIVLITHLVCGSVQSMKCAEHLRLRQVWKLPFLFLAFHFVYGWGMLYGFIKQK
jgi:succinoglycan biosynthesis protein ExoA